MENPALESLSPAKSTSSSPEFDFWMTGNPSCLQPDIFPADQLFVDGALLPLDLIPANQPDPSPTPDPEPPSSEQPGLVREPEWRRDWGHDSSVMSDPVPTLSASKRWRDIFQKGKGKIGTEKRRDERWRKRSYDPTGVNPAELKINIWPFSRSRSVGNNMTRLNSLGSKVTRKVSSTPCSRSNSSIKFPSSPRRAGVHLGRSSPVWQARRGGTGSALKNGLNQGREKGNAGGGKKLEVKERRRNKTVGADSFKGRVLNLNVPMCIGYGHNLSCRDHGNHAGRGTENGRGTSSGGSGKSTTVGGGGGVFTIRSLFTKKVY